MCGIVGATAQRNVIAILLEGLKKLEYRGYDSAGIAVIAENGINCHRQTGKVRELEKLLNTKPIHGVTGIAHTRWATHGKPTIYNAHPHIYRNNLAVVHNGIIENHAELRQQQQNKGFEFTSETDTEIAVHEIYQALKHTENLVEAVKHALTKLQGSYALGVVCSDYPDTLIACRKGSPLIIGVGFEEYFIASDVVALLPVTQRFIFLKDGDIAEITSKKLTIFNECDEIVEREIKSIQLKNYTFDQGKGPYRHYMLKEIFEQPQAIAKTLDECLINDKLQESVFGVNASAVFDQIKGVCIVACGTSYHAGLVARYWFESLAGVPCSVEVASEFRYRKPILLNNTLIVTISQSGETADTLAALQEAKRLGAKYSLAICNVPESSLVRESDLVIITQAGPEIGVASTKAFTTQLVVLVLLVLAIGRRFQLDAKMELKISQSLLALPENFKKVLQLNAQIKKIAGQFAEKQHALFLGRGTQYPIAMEGALKLKEISYIHAEAYPAGELKHGPLALIDANMPVITVAPNNRLLEKLRSNIYEVSARGGQIYVFIDEALSEQGKKDVHFIKVPSIDNVMAPIAYVVPLQLLSYHVAVLKGTDIDHPRNLAKSVTVE